MMRKHILGFDIGGTKCAAVSASAGDGIKINDRVQFDSETGKGFEHLLKNLILCGRRLTGERGGADYPAAIGISCGGPLDGKKGVVLSPPHLPGWDDIHICDILSREFGVPAFLQNDANACALVEWKLGAGRGMSDMVFITMGTGFGAGIIVNGQLLDGASSLAGEIGHVRLEPTGPVMYGKAGSVEAFCGGKGITEHYAKGADLKSLAAQARAGDKDARAVFDSAGAQLGRALAILIDILNPEAVVIGGIYTRCEDLLRAAAMRTLSEEALPGALAACRILPAETGEAIGDYACVMTACYAAGYDIIADNSICPAAATHLTALLSRYPVLRACETDIENAFILLRETFKNGKKLLCCGNGGSAADCGHIVGELMKSFLLNRGPGLDGMPHLQKALPALDLTQHNALNTAFSNDVDPALVFAQQVYGYGYNGDALLCISTSGNAANAVEAAKTARRLGIKVIALTGADGGLLKDLSDVTVRVPAHLTPEVQEFHLPVYHCLCAMLEAEFFSAVTI